MAGGFVGINTEPTATTVSFPLDNVVSLQARLVARVGRLVTANAPVLVALVNSVKVSPATSATPRLVTVSVPLNTLVPPAFTIRSLFGEDARFMSIAVMPASVSTAKLFVVAKEFVTVSVPIDPVMPGASVEPAAMVTNLPRTMPLPLRVWPDTTVSVLVGATVRAVTSKMPPCWTSITGLLEIPAEPANARLALVKMVIEPLIVLVALLSMTWPPTALVPEGIADTVTFPIPINGESKTRFFVANIVCKVPPLAAIVTVELVRCCTPSEALTTAPLTVIELVMK